MNDDAERTEPDSEVDPYTDAADRLEHTIDTQVSIINGIDDKAEHITRLIGVLLGLVFSLLSLIVNFDSINVGGTTWPVEVAFVLGILFLLVAMAAAIVTYLSSRFRIGLDYTVGHYLSNPETDTDFDTHIRRVLRSYGDIIKNNKKSNRSEFKEVSANTLLPSYWSSFSIYSRIITGGTSGRRRSSTWSINSSTAFCRYWLVHPNRGIFNSRTLR